jgi:regulator of protease activity HflC (stomatin/prohibitin superfamily)
MISEPGWSKNTQENLMRTVYFPIYVLQPYERGIQEVLGKVHRFVIPGLGFQIPFVQLIRIRDIREHTVDIHPQSMFTKDNIEIQVEGTLWVRPGLDEESIKRTFYKIDDWKRAIIQLVTSSLHQEFGNLTLEESLTSRQTKSIHLLRVLNTFAIEWGLTISKVEIYLIDLPKDIKNAMHKQKTSELERSSLNLLANAEFEAAEKQYFAVIQRAEGEREAVIQVARGKAEAIRLINEATEKFPLGNSHIFERMEMVDTIFEENTQIVIPEYGNKPTLLLGNPLFNVSIKKNDKSTGL